MIECQFAYISYMVTAQIVFALWSYVFVLSLSHDGILSTNDDVSMAPSFNNSVNQSLA